MANITPTPLPHDARVRLLFLLSPDPETVGHKLEWGCHGGRGSRVLLLNYINGGGGGVGGVPLVHFSKSEEIIKKIPLIYQVYNLLIDYIRKN